MLGSWAEAETVLARERRRLASAARMRNVGILDQVIPSPRAEVVESRFEKETRRAMRLGSWMRAALALGGGVLVLVAVPFVISQLFFSKEAVAFSAPDVANPGFQVTVVFDSLIVHDSREGLFSGDGEYDVVAYVQGVKVPLTAASRTTAFCTGSGCPGDVTMWDAYDEEEFTFVPGTQVTVALETTRPLSLFTAGVEVDGCGRRAFPEVTAVTLSPYGITLAEVFTSPTLDLLDWNNAVELFQSFVKYRTTCIAANGNDVLGSINRFFKPPTYEAGSHDDRVGNGDFTLRYTINVTDLNVVIK